MAGRAPSPARCGLGKEFEEDDKIKDDVDADHPTDPRNVTLNSDQFGHAKTLNSTAVSAAMM